MINKELIQHRFSKNLKNYNENAKVQKRMAEKLITLVQNKKPLKILEIGCGTGFLTELIQKNIEYKSFIVIDIVEDCKNFIYKINSNIEFINIDIEKYIENTHEKFDLIISNASLQWVDNFENVINKLKEMLNDNGELIFSTFGNENFKEIYHIMGTKLDYFSLNELQNMFPNIYIDQEIHVLAFPTPKDVLRHLQLTGVNSIKKVSWTKKDLQKFENGYNNLCSKHITLTYNPIYIKIK